MHENTKTQGQNRQRTFFIQKTQRHKEYRHTHIFLHKNTKTQGQSSHRIFLYIKHKTHKEYKYEQLFLAKNTETHGQNWHRILFFIQNKQGRRENTKTQLQRTYTTFLYIIQTQTGNPPPPPPCKAGYSAKNKKLSLRYVLFMVLLPIFGWWMLIQIWSKLKNRLIDIILTST